MLYNVLNFLDFFFFSIVFLFLCVGLLCFVGLDDVGLLLWAMHKKIGSLFRHRPKQSSPRKLSVCFVKYGEQTEQNTENELKRQM